MWKMIIFVLLIVASFEVDVKACKLLKTEISSRAEEMNGTSTVSIASYKALLKDILHDYDTRVRPRNDQSCTVEVNSTFTAVSVVDFDTTGQRIDVMGYITIDWNDELLRWDPKEYEWTTSVKIPVNNIWYPKLVLFRTQDENKYIGNVETESVTVFYDGSVHWSTDGIYSSMCEVSVKYYPFDKQTCELKYYPLGETVESVLLNGPEQTQVIVKGQNSEWKLVNASTRVVTTFSVNVIHTFLTIERRAEFTVYTMIVPLAMLALINVFTFLVPIESGEKGSLAMTLFLAYSFFATVTRDALPHNSTQVSYYIVYITVLLGLSLFTVIFVIFEAKIYSSLGPKTFTLCTFKAKEIETDCQAKSIDEEENDVLNVNGPTWAYILKSVNTIIFLISLVFTTIFSFVLWKTVMMRA